MNDIDFTKHGVSVHRRKFYVRTGELTVSGVGHDISLWHKFEVKTFILRWSLSKKNFVRKYWSNIPQFPRGVWNLPPVYRISFSYKTFVYKLSCPPMSLKSFGQYDEREPWDKGEKGGRLNTETISHSYETLVVSRHPYTRQLRCGTFGSPETICPIPSLLVSQ